MSRDSLSCVTAGDSYRLVGGGEGLSGKKIWLPLRCPPPALVPITRSRGTDEWPKSL